jgi:hypothetical protein
LDQESHLPNVVVKPVFAIYCDNPSCVDHEIDILFDRKAADDKAQAHLTGHREHEAALAKYIGEAAVQGETIGPIPRSMCCPGPRCGASIGEPHISSCDVARCLETGAQRVLLAHVPHPNDCGHDVWTGFYPGEKEAQEYGVPLNLLGKLGRWDKDKLRWVLDDGWEQRMQELGMGPRIS